MKKLLLSILVLVAVVFSIACEQRTSTSKKESRELPKELTRPEKTSDRPKIVAFGDSLTAGFGLSEKESYPYLLQQKLEKDGFDYEVINAGVSGDTTLGGLERIDWVLGQEKRKDPNSRTRGKRPFAGITGKVCSREPRENDPQSEAEKCRGPFFAECSRQTRWVRIISANL